MVVLVCGGRSFKDWRYFFSFMNNLHEQNPISCVISGCANGADTLAIEWAEKNNIPVEKYPALWDVHGRSAGPIRNQLMLDDGEPDLVVAFPSPNSRGTWDMIARAQKANVEVINAMKDYGRIQ